MEEDTDTRTYDTDGEVYAHMREMEVKRKQEVRAKVRQTLTSKKYSFQEIEGGFIINSLSNPWKKYYYYSYSGKWRAEGKNKYYKSKNLDDLLTRYIC